MDSNVLLAGQIENHLTIYAFLYKSGRVEFLAVNYLIHGDNRLDLNINFSVFFSLVSVILSYK